MKKILVAFLLLFSLASLSGCDKTKNLMSEQTRIVFAGEGENGGCLICVGEREDPYIVDGEHGQNTGFSLIVFEPFFEVVDSGINLSLEIDGKQQDVLMELNPINMTFVADLGYCLAENCNINISYQSETISMKNISSQFAVDYTRAIELGIEKVKEKEEFDDEEYESYLKIIEGERFGQDGYFWCFSVVSKMKESQNVLINTQTGEIILG